MTAIVIDDEEVMTVAEFETLVEIEELRTEMDALYQAHVQQFTQRPGYQNGMRGLEEMEAGR